MTDFADPATVKVVHGDGYMIINESDFDPDKHVRWSDKPKPAAKAPKPRRASKKKAAD